MDCLWNEPSTPFKMLPDPEDSFVQRVWVLLTVLFLLLGLHYLAKSRVEGRDGKVTIVAINHSVAPDEMPEQYFDDEQNLATLGQMAAEMIKQAFANSRIRPCNGMTVEVNLERFGLGSGQGLDFSRKWDGLPIHDVLDSLQALSFSFAETSRCSTFAVDITRPTKLRVLEAVYLYRGRIGMVFTSFAFYGDDYSVVPLDS
ncbi:hypothetical protein CONLIGDRAFT_648062 [Coniochaeta ligniaria NRRL 30616]|uniref:Uncharacterized protein n=1 Tax=Coniochaeta ligniaria NRRL 30616 TaxID=1408157 RepID=A0A1J7JBP8_9PEZI|nr:hypothetical protein CONLIGDRAFT_648062 [Coniochaeta ligniaria NRRL 30616]